jgi:plastocyanin
VIARATLAAAAVALAAAPPAAAATRAVQAVDSQSYGHYWTPQTLPAQQGDTIEWRFTEPGNPLAAQHDIWLIKPGQTPDQATQVGASYLGATGSAVVDQTGTYQFYCSIHGGLAPGGMNGTLTVDTTDPGPPVDPGTPWVSNAPPPGDSGPPPAANDSPPLAVFEQGDSTAPKLSHLKVTPMHRAVKVRVKVSEAGKLTVRVKRGAKLVKRARMKVKRPGMRSLTLKRLKPGRYRVQVRATDLAELESKQRTAAVRLKR